MQASVFAVQAIRDSIVVWGWKPSDGKKGSYICPMILLHQAPKSKWWHTSTSVDCGIRCTNSSACQRAKVCPPTGGKRKLIGKDDLHQKCYRLVARPCERHSPSILVSIWEKHKSPTAGRSWSRTSEELVLSMLAIAYIQALHEGYLHLSHRSMNSSKPSWIQKLM